MKKLFVFLICLITVLLYGCDPATFCFDYEKMKDDVAIIELITYNNGSSENIKLDSNSKLVFNKEKIISSKQLESQYIDEFLKELSKITFHLESKSTFEPIKECLKITKENDNFIILSCTVIDGVGYSMVAEFDSDGNFLNHLAYFADRPTYEKMIKEFFK